MTEEPQPLKSSTSRWVWSLPIAALALVLWLAAQSLYNKGPVIEIAFGDGRGIVRGQTMLQYRGIQVGKVIDTRLTKDLSKVIVTAQLAREAGGVALNGSQFWIVRPEVSLEGIRGLDTILSGVYIAVQPGEGEPAKRFEGLPEPPIVPGVEDLSIKLLTRRVNSTQTGSPVFFRNVSVGRVKSVALSQNGDHVELEATIGAAYVHLVRQHSRFWSEGGIDVKGSLLGVKIRADSLETILKGGVSFATPPAEKAGGPAAAGTVFILHDQPEDSWLEWGGDLPKE